MIKNPLFFSYFFTPNVWILQKLRIEKKDVFLIIENGRWNPPEAEEMNEYLGDMFHLDKAQMGIIATAGFWTYTTTNEKSPAIKDNGASFKQNSM